MDRSRWPIDEWRLVEKFPDPEQLGVTETLFNVGNGYLGMRGNVEEGRDSYAHGTFVNGFHETWPINHAEEAYGFARVGQTIVNVPDAKIIRLYVDDEPLLVSTANLTDYERSLDYREGVLRRSMIWQTPSGKRMRITSERMVSFTERHLAVMTFEIELLDHGAPVSIASLILNRQDGEDEYHVSGQSMGEGMDPRQANAFDQRVLDPQHHRFNATNERVELGYRCVESGMTLAVVADHDIETANDTHVEHHVDEDLAKVTYRIDAQPGVPIRLTKLVSYHTSRGVPVPELLDRCRHTLERARTHGEARLFADQAVWLNEFWERSDVQVAGQPEIQQAVRWNLFQVAQASIRAEGFGIAAKGVSGSGYSGHYFWDTEIYMMPFLTYTSPAVAKNALRFRYSLLPAARRRAREVAVGGALFPWRTINGEEASAYYAAGTAQYHIDADVSYALSQYVAATNDVELMRSEGVDILVETARMWLDLGFWRAEEDGIFHIHGVTGPDEYTTVVNDNLFTNVMAKFNLERAADAVTVLRERDPEAWDQLVSRLGLDDDEIDSWRKAAGDMAIPFDEHMGIHPQDQHFLEREVWDLERTPVAHRPLLLHYHPLVIYRLQVIKQADVVLAMFLQGDQFSAEHKQANFEYYDPITTGDSSLSEVMQSIMAAEVGYRDLAYRYFHGALFIDLADRHHNAADGVHVASAGGVWNMLVFGFGGFRDHGGQYTYDPRIPAAWDDFSYRVTLRGTRVRVAITQTQIRFTIESERLDDSGASWDRVVYVRGERIVLDPGRTRVVDLVDPGPVLEGSPPPVPGRRRADGTVISAVVPGTWAPRTGPFANGSSPA
ncbi:MAG: glycoside hydrolase family 65 protein [Actinomycetales bacterium]|nr:glycoside hydrolase family 65 protein [Actinomycetales bacterium]